MSGFCKDCNVEFSAFKGKMVMLKDELWLSICDDVEDVLCNDCIEKRLGRKINIDDLKLSYGDTYIPCNLIFMLYNNIEMPIILLHLKKDIY